MRSVLFVLLASAACVLAQNTGKLTGSVTDTSGAAIPGAKVELFLAGGSAPVLSTSTSSEGIFAFSSVRPESYDVVITSGGFEKFISRGVKVDPSRETALPVIKLQIQAAQQTVEVTADAQTVQTTNSEIATTVTQKQVRNLPVLDRQVSLLFLTQPGVSSGRGASTVNGLRSTFTDATLDGINIQDNYIRANVLDYIPSKLTIEQVAELTVSTSNADSSLGSGAAHLSMVTPSGTNQFHGNGYWYNRNNYFAANDWFNNRSGTDRPFLNQNQVGASLGGPIKKDKLLFYANYEVFRNHQQSPTLATVLTPDARNGIFTYRDSSGALQKVNLLARRGVSVDPSIQKLLAKVPTTINSYDAGDSQPGELLNTAGYQFNPRNNEDRNALTTKLDYVLSPRHSFAGSFVYNTDKVDRPDIDLGFEAVPRIYNDNVSKLMSVSWRWNVRPTLTNEVRGGFSLTPSVFAVSEKYASYLALGTSLLFNNPENEFMGQGRDTDTYVLQDNASWVKGKHNLTFGFQANLITTDPYIDTGIVPVYTLGVGAVNKTGFTTSDLPGISSSDLNTANALYANLAGIVSDARQTFNVTSRTSGYVGGATNRRHFRYNNYAGYVQDNWRLLPRLNINAGVRYDYQSPIDERDGLALMPVVSNNNWVATMRNPNAVIDFAAGGTGRPLYNKDLNNFAPNLGFAWDVFGNSKTAVRGGYALSYVNDEAIYTARAIMNLNAGLTSTVTRSGLDARFNAPPALDAPAFKVPRTQADNYALSTAATMGAIDPNLRTPYVQQWNFGIQQEVKGTIFEARYVGNHATKLLRVVDYNQPDIRSSGFLADVQRAQNNGFLALNATKSFNVAYNPNIPGSQPLTVLPTLGNGGNLTNATVLRYLRQGEAGSLAQYYQQNRLNGPINFFPNPSAIVTEGASNLSNSTYNAFQFDVRRRTRGGILAQFNYVFAKAMSDAAGDQQTNYEPYLDLNNPKIERARIAQDITHVFKANYVVDLPFGHNKRYFSSNGLLDRIIGGWALSGNLVYQSGTPFSILSQRGTVSSALGSNGASLFRNTASTNLTKGQLDKITGFFMTGNGPYFVDPSAIGPDGRGVASDGTPNFSGQVFSNPGAGTVGNLQRRYFSGPWYFNWDASAVKTIRITERQSLEFHADAFNLPNHPAFYAGNESSTVYTSVFDVNSTRFGKIISTLNTPRVLQFGLYYRF